MKPFIKIISRIMNLLFSKCNCATLRTSLYDCNEIFVQLLHHQFSMLFRWLDDGEDDGKVVRELKAQDEYMADILEKRNVCENNYMYNHDFTIHCFTESIFSNGHLQ